MELSLAMFKRKRSGDDSWDNFVNGVRSTVDNEYEQVNTIQTAPLSLKLLMSHRARIPLTLFDTLEFENYGCRFSIKHNSEKGKTSLILEAKYDVSRFRETNDTTKQKTTLQSPRYFMENNLKLRNKDAIHSVEAVVQEAQELFPRTMNWNNSGPYTIIYFKKHKQLIVRFQFVTDSISLDGSNKINRLQRSWIEYNEKTNTFYLVMIIEDCV